jgi:hypothetical protein
MADTALDLIRRRLDALEQAVAAIDHDGGSPRGTELPQPLPNKSETWLSRRKQAERWDVSVRTVERRGEDSELGLPPELEINGRMFRSLSSIEAWERARMQRLADR